MTDVETLERQAEAAETFAEADVEAQAGLDVAEAEGREESTPSDSEREARSQGWCPREEWRGAPGQWRSAEEFLKVNRQSAPILAERLRKKDEEHARRLERLERMHERSLASERERIQREYKTAAREAALNGDADRAEALIDERDRALGPLTDAPASLPSDIPVEVRDFASRHPWFLTDPQMHGRAVAVENYLAATEPGLSLQERLERTEAKMAELYPSVVTAVGGRSPTPRPGQPGMAVGGVRTTAKASPSAKLTAEERHIGEKFVKQGLYKTLDDYAKELADG